jgi:hypothetical protein
MYKGNGTDFSAVRSAQKADRTEQKPAMMCAGERRNG